MKGKRPNAPEPMLSIDRLTLTANLRRQDYDAWELKYSAGFVPAQVAKTKWGFDLYEKGYRLPDGTHVSLERTIGNHHEIRVQFNPNREPLTAAYDMTVPLLCCLENVGISQIDIALDCLGTRVHEYEFLYPRAKRTTTSTGYGYTQSMAFGAPRSDLQLLVYAKECQKKKHNDRILTIDGETITPEPEQPWLRMEASMKGSSVLRGDAFSGLKIFRRGSFKPPTGMSEKMAERLTAISHFPPAMDYPTVHKNTRREWREKLFEGVEMLEPHPQRVYGERLQEIKDYLSEFYLSPVGEDGLSQQTKRLLGV